MKVGLHRLAKNTLAALDMFDDVPKDMLIKAVFINEGSNNVELKLTCFTLEQAAALKEAFKTIGVRSTQIGLTVVMHDRPEDLVASTKDNVCYLNELSESNTVLHTDTIKDMETLHFDEVVKLSDLVVKMDELKTNPKYKLIKERVY